MAHQTIQVALGERSYPIHVVAEGLDGLGAALAGGVEPGPCVLVTNPVVAELYQAEALASLEAAGFEPRCLLVPDGESSKGMESWWGLVTALLDLGIDRRTPLLALGGGVTGDMVGFAAATVLRGVPLVQVPTTLLAMVDASVGGKTGFNTPHGKNLVGAFYQPRMVYAATRVLETLDDTEWRCGLGEAVKHGIIRDAAFVEWLEGNAAALRAREPRTTSRLVRRCCEIKAEVVAADELEGGLRAILNFGHTVGHALETALGHGSLAHGEAVALGMLVETRFASARGWCEQPEIEARIAGLYRALGLPVALPRLALESAGPSLHDKLVRAAGMDKKTVRGRLNLVVPTRLGEVRLVSVPAGDVSALLELTESWEIS